MGIYIIVKEGKLNNFTINHYTHLERMMLSRIIMSLKISNYYIMQEPAVLKGKLLL